MSRAARSSQAAGWLVVFAKLPRAGFVKTRLSPAFSPAAAAALYACMLDDVVEESARAARGLGFEMVLSVTPDAGVDVLAARAPVGVRCIAQRGVDLSARMTHVARQAAAAGARAALLRGSDSPALARGAMCALARELDDADCSLCADSDGGYNAIALGPRALSRGFGGRAIFDHPMSTASVLADTLAAASALDLVTSQIDPGFDIDRVEDLRRLSVERRSGGPLPCPRTLEYLDRTGSWPG